MSKCWSALHWIRLVALPVDISIVLNRASGFHTRILISLQVLFVFVDFFFGNTNLFFFRTLLIIRHSFFTCDTLKWCICSAITNKTTIFISMGAILLIELCIRCEPFGFESVNAFHKCKRLLKATKFNFKYYFHAFYIFKQILWDMVFASWSWNRDKERKPYAVQTIQYTVQCHVVFYVCANIPFKWTRWLRKMRKQHSKRETESESELERRRDRKKRASVTSD